MCLGAVAVMLQWPAFWGHRADVFGLPWLVPVVGAGGLVSGYAASDLTSLSNESAIWAISRFMRA